MNHRQRISRAITLITPVLSSVTGRTPRGMSAREADQVTTLLRQSRLGLETALEIYARHIDQDGKPKPILIHATGGGR